jgi:hypothetical protein
MDLLKLQSPLSGFIIKQVETHVSLLIY